MPPQTDIDYTSNCLHESGLSHFGLIRAGWARVARHALVLRSSDGKELDRMARAVEIDFDGQHYQAFLKEGVHASATVNPKPDTAELKIVVIDRTSGHVGSLAINLPEAVR